MKRRKIAARRLTAALLCMALSGGMCGPAMATSVPVTETAPAYTCGMEEHSHGPGCMLADPVGDVLARNGLAGFEGRIYIVHQHGESCYGEDGILTCPLSDPAYMAGYPNVFVIHHHEDGCGDAGCAIADNQYEIMDGEGKAVSRHGSGAPGGLPDEGVYVNGVPGGVKDVGETTGDKEPVYKVGYHVHDAFCGGVDGGCERPVVVELPGSWAGRVACGKAEHTHGEACLPKDDIKTPDVPSLGDVLGVLGEMEATGWRVIEIEGPFHWENDDATVDLEPSGICAMPGYVGDFSEFGSGDGFRVVVPVDEYPVGTDPEIALRVVTYGASGPEYEAVESDLAEKYQEVYGAVGLEFKFSADGAELDMSGCRLLADASWKQEAVDEAVGKFSESGADAESMEVNLSLYAMEDGEAVLADSRAAEASSRGGLFGLKKIPGDNVLSANLEMADGASPVLDEARQESPPPPLVGR